MSKLSQKVNLSVLHSLPSHFKHMLLCNYLLFGTFIKKKKKKNLMGFKVNVTQKMLQIYLDPQKQPGGK